VATHVYDHRSAVGKVRRKLTHELPGRLGLPSTPDAAQGRAAIARIAQERPDVLVVVKGDDLGTEFWERAERFPRRALWLYDEVRRTTHTSATLAAAGPIASYSPHDVAALGEQGLDATHLPLAHDRDMAASPAPPRQQIVFVGARYPKRESILTTLHAAGLPVRAYGRDWSAHPVDRARTWRLRASALPADRDLARPDAYNVMAAATVSLNIHGDQDGFTMRTFEVPGVGGLQLVDRLDVSRHYEPGEEVLAFETAEQAIDLCRRALSDPAWAAGIRAAGHARTLAEHTFDHRVAELERLWA
jgi:spore maturation protein CgeB